MYFLQIIYAKLCSWKLYGFYGGSTDLMLTLLDHLSNRSNVRVHLLYFRGYNSTFVSPH